MKCKKTGKPCDPKSYYCHLLEHTSKRIQNKTCERLIHDEEAEAEQAQLEAEGIEAARAEYETEVKEEEIADLDREAEG